MRKLIVVEFLTLDGVMQAPGDPNEDRRDGFDQGGWQLKYFDSVIGDAIQKGLAETGGFLLGRKTFEIFKAHWPNQPADDPLAGTFNDLPKWVVSTTLTEPLGWQNSTLIRGDVAGQIRQIKEQPGKEIQVIGSGELVQSLMRDGLVDEYRLMIHPLVLGTGRRLFREANSPMRLRLVGSVTTDTGVLILTYAPAEVAEQERVAVGAGQSTAG
jgi:dihydrofolate reductase